MTFINYFIDSIIINKEIHYIIKFYYIWKKINLQSKRNFFMIKFYL